MWLAAAAGECQKRVSRAFGPDFIRRKDGFQMENKTSGGVQPSEKVVYLDNAATTACAPEVLAVMVEALSGACGNPSSHYSVGYEAKEFVASGFKSFFICKSVVSESITSISVTSCSNRTSPPSLIISFLIFLTTVNNTSVPI